MGLRIQTNIPALAVSRVLNQTSDEFAKTTERLASGRRITQSADDAAGLAISEQEKAQIKSTAQAERNANDALSFVQVAEGGMSEIGDLMTRLRELAIQSASDTVDDRIRSFIHEESKGIVEEINQIANGTNFNGVSLLNGGNRDKLSFQVGIGNTENDRLTLDVQAMDIQAAKLGIGDINLATSEGSLQALGNLDEGMSRLYSARSEVGAIGQRLQTASKSLAVSFENLSVARSRIMDADVAKESSELARENVLRAAGTAVLAQANTAPMQALKLIG